MALTSIVRHLFYRQGQDPAKFQTMKNKRKSETETGHIKPTRDVYWRDGILTIAGTTAKSLVDHAIEKGWATKSANVFAIDNKPLNGYAISQAKNPKVKR